MNAYTSALLICLVCCSASLARAQESATTDTNLSFAVVRTQLEQQALAVAARVLPKINEEVFVDNESWIGSFAPDVEVRTGGNDTFDSFIAKFSGFMFSAPTRDGTELIDLSGFLHVIPLSAGFETGRNFDDVAALVEVGWVPIGSRQPDRERFGFAEERRFGIFLQGGYKFDNNSDELEVENEGGNANESFEETESAVVRVKATLAYGVTLGNVSLIPVATGWYDIANSELYYRIEMPLRIHLSSDGKYALEFKYEKGSGAPAFNEGEQFGVGLAFTL